MGIPTTVTKIGHITKKVSGEQVRYLLEILDDEINLRPEYQRAGNVWVGRDKKLLIDSILRGYDIPKLYMRSFGEDSSRKIEVVDGQQRIEALIDFKNNKLSLPKGTEIEGTCLSRKLYRQLPDKFKKRFDKYELHITTFENISDEECREMFRRMQHGKPLNTAEKRNSYSGKMTEFIKSLSEYAFFSNSKLRATRSNRLQIATCFVQLERHRMAVAGSDSKGSGFKLKNKYPSLISAQLDKLVTDNKEIADDDLLLVSVRNVLSYMGEIFKPHPGCIKATHQVVSLYCICSEFVQDGLRPHDFVDKYLKFEELLTIQKALPISDRIPELETYMARTRSNTDKAESIEYRVQVIKKHYNDATCFVGLPD